MQYLAKCLDDASSQRDTPESREQLFDCLLTALIANTGQPWFADWLGSRLRSIYPKPHRVLTDAVLQAFVAASPLHCGYVLPSLLHGTLCRSAPVRRDILALFQANTQLTSCWLQQGAVCCSIVSFLATEAAERMYALWQQQQQQQHLLPPSMKSALPSGTQSTAHPQAFKGPAMTEAPTASAERLGAAIGCLTDCLLQAVPQHKLHFMQLALACFVAKVKSLEQQHQQQPTSMEPCEQEPLAKRRRLEDTKERQQLQSVSVHNLPSNTVLPSATAGASRAYSGGSRSSSSWPSSKSVSVHLGLQLLGAMCACERVYNKESGQLLLVAAPVAAAAAASLEDPQVVWADLQPMVPVFQQLFQQVTAAAASGASSKDGPAGHASAASAATAAAAASIQQQLLQQPVSKQPSAGLTPTAALQKVIEQLAPGGPLHVLTFVCMLMARPVPAAAAARAARVGHAQLSPTGLQAGGGGGGGGRAAAAESANATWFESWLVTAGQQWQKEITSAAAHAGRADGNSSNRGRGSQRGAARGTGAKPVPALQLGQLLPAAAAVSSTWVCKHILSHLALQAGLEFKQQQHLHLQQLHQHQQQTDPLQTVAQAPSTCALLHLLAAEGLLLPASGEALVAARAVAESLNGADLGLQRLLVSSWQHLLLVDDSDAPTPSGAVPGALRNANHHQQQQEHHGAGAMQQSSVRRAVAFESLPSIPWPALQPMLCVLSHLEGLDTSPVAAFLAGAASRCLASSSAGNAVGERKKALPLLSNFAQVSSSSTSSSAMQDLKHLLLPLRFGLSVPARVWLLQQLLLGLPCLSTHQEPAAAAAGSTAADASPLHSTPQQDHGDVATQLLQALEQLLGKQCSKQLAEGLGFLAAQADSAKADQQGNAATKAAVSLQTSQARDLADVVLQLQQQLLAAAPQQEVGFDGGTGAEARADADAWPLQAAARLQAVLVAADRRAFCKLTGTCVGGL